MRRLMRFILRLGAFGGLAVALYKVVQSRRPSPTGELPWVNGVSRRPDLPEPAPAVPLLPTSAAAVATDAATVTRSRPPTGPESTVAQAPVAKAATATTPETTSPVADPVPGNTGGRGAGAPTLPEEDGDGAPSGSGEAAGSTVWVAATGVVCPPSHPVKAKLASRLYHLPGMSAYARTKPDRCYPDEATAEADGLTKARR